MDAHIEERFGDNIGPVRNIVRLYSEMVGASAGGPSLPQADVLRGAVILLHAALEDLVRGIVEARLPESEDAEILGQIPLAGFGNQRKTSFTFAELSAHRGRTVDEVIRRSVTAFLERANYNHPGDIKRQLAPLGISPSLIDPFADELAALRSRRHVIAHRADRNDAGSPRPHQVRSINRATALTWIKAVEEFGESLLRSLRS